MDHQVWHSLHKMKSYCILQLVSLSPYGKKVALKTIHYNNLLFIQNISTFLIGSNPAVYSYTLLARIDQIWKQFVMYG